MRRRPLRIALLLAALAFVATPLVLWRMSRMPPSWWARPEAGDAAVRDLASRVEKRLAEETHKMRSAEETWTLRIREEQVNAWLAARLPAWVAHERNVEWPGQLGPPQVRFVPEGIDVAFELLEGGHARYVEVRLLVAIEDGRIRLGLDGAALGRIPVPGEPLDFIRPYAVEAIAEHVDAADLDRVAGLLSGRDSVEAVVELSDGRRVRLVALRHGEGVLDLTCRTLGGAPTELTGPPTS